MLDQDSRSETDGETEEATVRGAVVRVGPVQHLAFVEDEEELPEYDGHHICVYLSEEGVPQYSNYCDEVSVIVSCVVPIGSTIWRHGSMPSHTPLVFVGTFS